MTTHYRPRGIFPRFGSIINTFAPRLTRFYVFLLIKCCNLLVKRRLCFDVVPTAWFMSSSAFTCLFVCSDQRMVIRMTTCCGSTKTGRSHNKSGEWWTYLAASLTLSTLGGQRGFYQELDEVGDKVKLSSFWGGAHMLGVKKKKIGLSLWWKINDVVEAEIVKEEKRGCFKC